jgi:hypothetical protein
MEIWNASPFGPPIVVRRCYWEPNGNSLGTLREHVRKKWKNGKHESFLVGSEI